MKDGRHHFDSLTEAKPLTLFVCGGIELATLLAIGNGTVCGKLFG
jgi:hypothetical protein